MKLAIRQVNSFQILIVCNYWLYQCFIVNREKVMPLNPLLLFIVYFFQIQIWLIPLSIFISRNLNYVNANVMVLTIKAHFLSLLNLFVPLGVHFILMLVLDLRFTTRLLKYLSSP